MTFQTNDNIANHELSIEELDTIAAGSLFGDIGGFFSSVGSSIVSTAEDVYHEGYLFLADKRSVVYAAGYTPMRGSRR
jgi:hypothetical protein